ncbi:hypothetical protein KQX54_009968 [Cotesia glomerata]|uniref:Uncharacterized protein n=1 Tax=Cotesia glomerata TaxID=32391 RepID=A0AAV7IGI2_COTGL|nr:hypothetical protein KQX54_009968 [Cotesia glomerata]
MKMCNGVSVKSVGSLLLLYPAQLLTLGLNIFPEPVSLVFKRVASWPIKGCAWDDWPARLDTRDKRQETSECVAGGKRDQRDYGIEVSGRFPSSVPISSCMPIPGKFYYTGLSPSACAGNHNQGSTKYLLRPSPSLLRLCPSSCSGHLEEALSVYLLSLDSYKYNNNNSCKNEYRI